MDFFTHWKKLPPFVIYIVDGQRVDFYPVLTSNGSRVNLTYQAEGHVIPIYEHITDDAELATAIDTAVDYLLEKRCRDCKGYAIRSLAYADAHTIPKDTEQQTILPGRGNLITCFKCSQCGHSWT